MNTSIKRYLLSILSLFVMTSAFLSCDDKTLDSADNTYITIYPSDIVLTYPIDTINLVARVNNKDGYEFDDANLKWEVEDASVAKIIEGNRLIALEGSQGKSTLLKVALENGKVATTTVTVRTLNASEIKIYEPVASGPNTILKELVNIDTYVGLNTPKDYLFQVKPEAIIFQENFTFPNLDPSEYKIEPVDDKDLSDDRIKLTPKGGKWFKITALKEMKGKIDISIGGTVDPKDPNKKVGDIRSKISIVSGPLVQSLGLNKDMNEYEGNGVMNINKQDSVKFFIDISPADDESIKKVLDASKWTIDGGIARIIKKGFEKTKDDSKLFFYAIVESYEDKGNISVSINSQSFSARKSIKIEDIQSLKVNSLSITPTAITDMLVGETKSLRVKMEPATSYPFLVKEFVWTVQNPEIAVVEKNDIGAFFVKGLKSGETNVTLRVRDKEATIHLVVKPKPKSVLINNDTPVTLMLGDAIEWSANVVMEGGDTPDYKLLNWADITGLKTPLTFISPKTGKTTKIKAASIEDGKEFSTAKIEVNFRGQKATRDLKIFPVQSNVDLQADDINLEQAGVTTDNGQISILLTLKKDVKKANITIKVKTASNLNKVQAGEYNASSDKINVIWKSGLEKIATTGTLNLTNTGSKKFSVKADLVLKVGDKNVIVKVDAQNLEEYYN